MTVRRVIRRTIAPLLTGALAATSLVAVADAGALPGRDVLGQGAETRDDDSPADLDELIARPVPLDVRSVFADLEGVGEFSLLYEYGGTDTVDVASELELFSDRPLGRRSGADDGETGGAPGIVGPVEAARRFLPSARCNPAQALTVKQQVRRPILATIFRPDERQGGGAPLVDQVEVGSVVVSVLDFDLWRARPPTLLQRLLAADGVVARELGSTDLDRGLDEPHRLYDALVTSCLRAGAEQGSVPARHTVRGEAVESVKLEDPVDRPTDLSSSGIDVLNWTESTDLDDVALDIRIETTFDRVEQTLGAGANFDTRTWLELYADPVEPALEVAAAIVGRDLDTIEELRREAFSAVGDGFEYGPPVAGTERVARTALRRGSETIAPEVLQALVGDDASLSSRARGATSRLLFEEGELFENQEALHSRPRGPIAAPEAVVRAVFWDPELLNSDAFRAGWKAGLSGTVAPETDLESVVDPVGLGRTMVDALASEALRARIDDLEVPRRRELFAEVGRLAFELAGVVDLVAAERDGITRFHWLAPCYAMTVSARDAGTAATVFEQVVLAQLDARSSTGRVVEDLGGVADPAPGNSEASEDPHRGLDEELFERLERGDLISQLDLGIVGGPAVDLLEQGADLPVAYAREVAGTTDGADEDPTLDATRRRQQRDRTRAAQCSVLNLIEHLDADPLTDENGNGIDDSVPGDDVTASAEDDE